MKSRNWLTLGASAAALLFLAGAGYAQEAGAEGYVPEEARINISNILKWGGWCGWIIILHSVVMVALVIEHFVNIKIEKIVPPGTVDEIEALFEEEDYQEALEYCEANPNFVTNLIAAGLPKLNAGFDTMKQYMGDQAATEATLLHQKISYLALIGNLAPMWGLFGTVQGMIFAFAEIVILGPKVTPKHLAFGVQQALITTLEGLLVAIPSMLFFFYFRNRVVRLVNEMTASADDLVERFRPQKS